MALNAKQQRFVDEYLVDLNATQAAIRAGYSGKTAGQQGERLLKNVEIDAAVQTAMNKRAERTEITADYVISNLAQIVERCMERAPVMEGRGENAKQVRDDEGRHVWEFNATGANKALELLGKHLSLFKDRVEHSVADDLASVLLSARQRGSAI